MDFLDLGDWVSVDEWTEETPAEEPVKEPAKPAKSVTPKKATPKPSATKPAESTPKSTRSKPVPPKVTGKTPAQKPAVAKTPKPVLSTKLTQKKVLSPPVKKELTKGNVKGASPAQKNKGNVQAKVVAKSTPKPANTRQTKAKQETIKNVEEGKNAASKSPAKTPKEAKRAVTSKASNHQTVVGVSPAQPAEPSASAKPKEDESYDAGPTHYEPPRELKQLSPADTLPDLHEHCSCNVDLSRENLKKFVINVVNPNCDPDGGPLKKPLEIADLKVVQKANESRTPVFSAPKVKVGGRSECVVHSCKRTVTVIDLTAEEENAKKMGSVSAKQQDKPTPPKKTGSTSTKQQDKPLLPKKKTAVESQPNRSQRVPNTRQSDTTSKRRPRKKFPVVGKPRGDHLMPKNQNQHLDHATSKKPPPSSPVKRRKSSPMPEHQRNDQVAAKSQNHQFQNQHDEHGAKRLKFDYNHHSFNRKNVPGCQWDQDFKALVQDMGHAGNVPAYAPQTPVWKENSAQFYNHRHETYRPNTSHSQFKNASETLEDGEIYDGSNDAMFKKLISPNRMDQDLRKTTGRNAKPWQKDQWCVGDEQPVTVVKNSRSRYSNNLF